MRNSYQFLPTNCSMRIITTVLGKFSISSALSAAAATALIRFGKNTIFARSRKMISEMMTIMMIAVRKPSLLSVPMTYMTVSERRLQTFIR